MRFWIAFLAARVAWLTAAVGPPTRSGAWLSSAPAVAVTTGALSLSEAPRAGLGLHAARTATATTATSFLLVLDMWSSPFRRARRRRDRGPCLSDVDRELQERAQSLRSGCEHGGQNAVCGCQCRCPSVSLST